MVTFSIIKVEQEFIKKPIFNLKSVEINKLSENLSSDIEPLKKSLINKNIYEIDIDFLEKMLNNDIRIESAKVEKVGLNNVVIDIKEREVSFYAQMQGKIYLLDDKGVIFGTLNERDRMNLPIFYIKKLEEIPGFIKIFQKIDGAYLKDIVSQVYTDNKNSISLILNNGAVFKTDLSVNKEKYIVGEALYVDLSKTKKIEYIDLRFQDFVIKCLGEKNEK